MNVFVNFNLITENQKEAIRLTLFNEVNSLEDLEDDRGMSIYAQHSLGIGESNMNLYIILLLIPPAIMLSIAGLASGCHNNFRMPRVFERLLRFIQGRIMFNAVIRYLLMTYLTFALATLISSKKFDMSFGDTDTLIWLVCLLYVLFSPIVTFILLWYFQNVISESQNKRINKLNEPHHFAKYGTIYIDLDTSKTTRLTFTMVYLLRRLFLAFVITFTRNTIMQLFLI